MRWGATALTSSATAAMVQAWPGIRYTRDFGTDRGLRLTAPDAGKALVAPADCLVHYSWKGDIGQAGAWLDALTGPAWLSFHHEPMGDVEPAVYRQRGAELAALIAAHPAGKHVMHGPVVTRYWLVSKGGNPLDWWYEGASFYGVDVYNDSKTRYREPAELFGEPLDIVRRALPGVPLCVPEFGLARIDGDTDGTGRAEVLARHVDWLRQQPDLLAVGWWDIGGNQLSTPAGDPAAAVWADALAAQHDDQEDTVTVAKPALLDARQLLIEHLDIDPAAVGIVGDSAHVGGYHCGRDRVVPGDYSVVESPRDRAGLSQYASALDIGAFSVTAGGRTHDLRSFSRWLVDQCERGAPDTQDIREVIYSPDGKFVRRWDRLRVRTGGDDSHLWHTHISEHRDADGSRMVALITRYLTDIGILEDDMPTVDEIARAVWARKLPSPTLDATFAADGWLKRAEVAVREIRAWRKEQAVRDQAIMTALAGVGATVDVDEAAIAQAVLAGLSPEQIAAALPVELAEAVVDELVHRLTGTSTAAAAEGRGGE